MAAAPEFVGNLRLVCYSPIDSRHQFTGITSQVVAEKLMGAMSGLAIYRLPDSKAFYLFGCDSEWNVVTDTWHRSIEEAKDQAEFEYEGVNETWITHA